MSYPCEKKKKKNCLKITKDYRYGSFYIRVLLESNQFIS